MKRSKLFNVFSWSMTHVSWMTMAISPVAMGAEAKKTNVNQFKLSAKKFGLNQKTTLAEFWAKSKSTFPGYMYKSIEALVEKHPNMLMPQMEIKTSKASDGTEIPTVYFTENGKTQTVQIYGETDKFLKWNGVVLTEKEFQLPQKMLGKLAAVDPKFKKELDLKIRERNLDIIDAQKRPFRDFRGFPRITKEFWQSQKMDQRIRYIIEMRELNAVADEVLFQKSRARKTSSFDYFQKMENAWAFLVGDAAYAQNLNAVNCINQGYVSRDKNVYGIGQNDLGMRKSCLIEEIQKQPRFQTDMHKKAFAYCKEIKNSYPCNPEVYSYNPSTGNPYCSEPATATGFQSGTHWKGSCDNDRRLSHNFISDPNGLMRGKDANDRAGRLNSNKGKDLTGLDHDKVIEKIKADQASESYRLTQEFLLGMLRNDDPDGKDSFSESLKSGRWSQELEDKLLGYQTAFESNITESMKLCSADLKKENSSKNYANEQNYRDACEQLHRRWLFTKEYLATIKCSNEKDQSKVVGQKNCAPLPVPPVVVPPEKPEIECPGGSVVVGEMCQCNGGPSKDRKFSPTELLPDDCKEQPPKTCEQQYPGATGLNKECLCENSNLPPQCKEKGFFDNLFSNGSQENQVKYECESNWNWPIIGIGVGLAGLALWACFKNDDQSNSPPPVQPPVVPPAQCPANTTGTPPNCVSIPGRCAINPATCAFGMTNPDTPLCKCKPQPFVPPTCNLTANACQFGISSTCTCNPAPTPRCSAPQILLASGSCGCANVSGCAPGNFNSASCTCTPAPGEGGAGNNTCARPPCGGGVPLKTGK